MITRVGLPFPLVRASGNAIDRGRAYGVGASEQIARSIEFYATHVIPPTGTTWESIKAGLEPLIPRWRSVDPSTIDEMEGIAEGAGVDFGDIVVLNCRGAFTAVPSTPEDGCTSFSVLGEASATGHQFTGQNWDYLTGISDSIVLVLFEPDDGPKQLLIVEAGQIGRHGYNEAGVALHANGLSGALRDKDAVPSPIWRRRILRQWTISDALDAALITPRPGTTNLLISHKGGFTVDLETTPKTSEALFPEHGWLVHTNHFIGPVPEALRPTYNPSGDSLLRLGRAKHILGSAARDGGIEVADIVEMLRDHLGRGQSLCAHPDETQSLDEQWGTVASVVTDLTEGVMWMAAGPPCVNEYAELRFADIF